MAFADDFSIAANGDIRHTSGATTYTVLQMHRALMALADDAVAAGDDLMDISYLTPSDRSTDNIVTLLNGYNIDDTAATFLYDGSVTQAGGDDIYAGLRVVGSVEAGTNVIIVQNGALLTDTWSTEPNDDPGNSIILQCLVKTRSGGANIDGQRLIVQAREYGDTYSEFNLTCGLGFNVAALSTVADLNNATASGTVLASAIANDTEGYVGLDISGDTVNEFYYSEWDLNGESINTLYEYGKAVQRRGTAETVYGISGALFRGITHEIVVDTPTGTFNAFEPVSWTGGTGHMLAINSPTAATKMWLQLLTGNAPTDGQTITGGTSSATADVNVTVTQRTVPSSMIGASTGSSIIGAYGIGIDPADLTASDQLFDLDNALTVPPNNVTFTVSGLVIGEDRVLVGPESGGSMDEAQDTIDGALTGAAVTSVPVTTAIPTDTPSSGTLRIETDDGRFLRVPFSSYSGSTYTIPSFDFSGTNNCADLNNVFISYIDKLATATSESFTGVFLSTRPLFIRVRDGGGSPIKTFETTGSLGSAGGSSTAIRTSDA